MSCPHRTYCDTVNESTSIVENTNLFNYKVSMSTLRVLLEEMRMHGNRMEAGLYYHKDIEALIRERAILTSDIRRLKLELGEVTAKRDTL